ncbi:MAG: pyruvate-formate lyase [Epulopiscium sp. Nuni2H_MBin003]|nr:MAG: pyruvate-formate lyase [Epulopiscium sp. Nuni2H_MBin003]
MLELTPRLNKIKKRLFDVEFQDPGVWHFADTNILDKPENAWMINEPMVVRKAYSHMHICENLPTIIKDDELIVGCPNQNSVGWGSTIPKYFSKEEGEIAERYELNESSIWGHHPPAYNRIIDEGVEGVKATVYAAMNAQLALEKPDAIAIDEYRAMIVALDGLVVFARRYANEALRLASECVDKVRKDELMNIYRVCTRVPLKPATCLQEALQAYWFTYAIVNSGGEFIPLGRADQYLFKYYDTDIKAGKISKEDAIDLIASFLVKCNERIIIDTKKAENHYNFGLFSQGVVIDESEDNTKVNSTGGYGTRALTWQYDEEDDSEANFNYGQSGNDWLMNCMVGGVDTDGNDATNEVSYLFVDIMHSMEMIMPTLGARMHKNTPRSFIELVASVLRTGQGEPMIYNDESIIPGLIDLGVDIKDARHYCNDGCWEVLVAGKSHFSYAHVMNLRCLEWVLFRGKSLHNNEQEGLDTGDPTQFANFDEFYEAYLKQMNDRIDFQCEKRIENFGLSFMIAPDPLFSSITDDCIKNGRDISQDGARYIFHMVLCTGLANTVDSLIAIKKLVFEENSITMEELITALKDNWVGHERLHAKVLNRMPKFGNDNTEVDDLAVKLLKDFENRILTWRGKHEKIKFPCGIGTFENYAALGRDIGASADGRKFGEQLAPNYSPVPGMDLQGPTSVMKSIAKADLKRFYAGSPVDISVNSGEFEGDKGTDRMIGLIQSFCELGGQILTINCTDIEELKDAKVNPQNHKNLRVRMGGLAAYFIAMSPVQQDNMIKRFAR